MSTTLPLFWHLSSASKDERLDASVKLVGALEQFQSQFVRKESMDASGTDGEEDGEDEDEKMDNLDNLNAQDVSYSIRRLIRGLSSPRESSRLGFAVALTELLARLDTVTCSQILLLVVDATKSQGSMTGQEERDAIFARLFGLTAIIQSGLLVRTTPLPFSASSETSASSSSAFKDAVSHLIALGDKKSWLRESAWWSLGLAMDALKASEVTWKESASDAIIELVFNPNTPWSPEKIAIALKLQNANPKRDWRALLCPPFKSPDLLASTNLPAIGKILKDTTTEADSENGVPKSAAGSWTPQLHFVWSAILDQLLPGPDSVSTTKGSFQEFFRIVVDESLFSSNSSPERKYSGFQVFRKALPRVTEDDIPLLFTKNFMRSWINHLSHSDRYLHKVAKQVSTDIQNLVKTRPQLGFALILQLTGVNGSQQFDKLTKSKTVESILTSMSADGIKSYINHIIAQVNSAVDVDVDALNSRRSWIIDQLSALIHNGAVPKDDECTMIVLDWFAVHGLFLIKKKSEKSAFLAIRQIPSPPFSDQLRQQCRTRLLSCLADLLGQAQPLKIAEDKSLKRPGVASDGEYWLSKVLGSIDKLQADSKRVSLLSDAEEDDLTLATKVREGITRLKALSEPAAQGAQLLLLGVLIQFFVEEPTEKDAEVISDCLDATDRMFAAPKKSKSKKKKVAREEAGAEESAPEPVDVMLDCIIGFLEKGTAFIRTLGTQVFSLLTGSAQRSTIELMLSQLERRNPDELAQDEDEDMSQDEVGSNVEEEDDSDSEIEFADEPSDDEVDPELRRKIEEALRVNGIGAGSDNDEDGDDDDASDDDEDLMDDEQMLAIDEQLAQFFKSRDEKGKNGDAQREATHFKNRVLDLVDTFLKNEPSNPLSIDLLLPLIELSLGSSVDERHLTDKARGIVRSRFAKCKEHPTVVDSEPAKSALSQIHSRAQKLHSAELLPTLSQCSLYLVKVLLDAKSAQAVVDVYRSSLQDFATRKNSALNGHFFTDAINRFPGEMWELRNDIFTFAEQAVNGFRRTQCLQLVQPLLTRISSIEDKREEAEQFLLAFSGKLAHTVDEACSDKITLTPSQMKDLLKLGAFAVRLAQRLSARKGWDFASWSGLAKKLAESERFKSSVGLQKMCANLCASPPGSNGKRKAAAVEEETPKAKRKKTSKK